MARSNLKHNLHFTFRALDLKKPIFKSTTAYGHFGRSGFTWETPKELEVPEGIVPQTE